MGQLTRALHRSTWNSPRAYRSLERLKFKPLTFLVSIGIAVAIALSLSQISHASERLPGIIGLDDRTSADTDRLPWAAIGRVNRETGGFCTGVLISPNEVLTAAHCLWHRRAGRWLPPDAVHFVTGWSGKDYTAHSKAVSFRVASGIRMSAKGRPSRLVNDWAILTLEEPIGNKVGFVPMAAAADRMTTKYSRSSILSTAAYNADRPNRLLSDKSCSPHVAVEAGPILLHDCDLTYGTSGAPIIIERDGGFRVVGVQVAVVRNASQERGVAVIPQGGSIAASAMQW